MVALGAIAGAAIGYLAGDPILGLAAGLPGLAVGLWQAWRGQQETAAMQRWIDRKEREERDRTLRGWDLIDGR